MKQRTTLVLVVTLLLAAGTAWALTHRAGRGPMRPQPASVAVTWRGKYGGTMVLPATLHWCPVSRIGVLEAISGDSGIMVALYERNSLTAAVHPIVAGDAATAPRPGASVALRWMRFEPDTGLSIFRSTIGTARLTLSAGKASGDFTARMQSVTGNDTLRLQAAFREVPVVTTAAGCT